MRSINLIFMFGIAGVSALLGAMNLIASINNLPRSAALVASLAGLSLISLAYAFLILRRPMQGIAGHFLLLALYMVSSITGFIAGSNIGLIPYVMTSMALSLVPALDYIWRPFLIFASISAVAYALAYLYIRRQSANINP